LLPQTLWRQQAVVRMAPGTNLVVSQSTSQPAGQWASQPVSQPVPLF
jgi:hypothetical protein